MGKIIVVCNQKGGVGKTTTSLNLAASLALRGSSVLLIDLDPQANATSGLGIDKKTVKNSTYQVLLEQFPMREAILQTKIQGLSLLPSHVSLSGAEVELVNVLRREDRLKQALFSVEEKYEIIFIDCPPSLGLLTINALSAAHSVLIPLQCEYYALEGLSQLLETVRLVQENLNEQLAIEGILLTMADFRTKLTQDVIQEVRRYFGTKVYGVIIPRSVRLSEAPSHGVPIALYDPDSSGAQAYQLLAEKIKENLHVRDAWFGQRDPGPDTGKGNGSDSFGKTDEPAGDQRIEEAGRSDSHPDSEYSTEQISTPPNN